MVIIAGYSLTEAADRDAPVAAFPPMVERARREGGCIDVHISAGPLDAERINVFESWPDRASLDAWPKIADPPEVAFREIHVDLFRPERAESPF